MTHVTVNGRRQALVESGSGEPLLLLHGGNADRRQFDLFRPLLGAGVRAIAYDQREAPDSPCEPTAYTIADHADDAATLLDVLGLSRAHIFGTSYGGAVAMTLAMNHPDRVSTLVLGATAAKVRDFCVPDAVTSGARDHSAIERFMLSAVITPEALDNDPVLVGELRAGLVPRSPEVMARRMAALASFDVTDKLKTIGAPTLILQGDEDPIIRLDTARDLAAAIPGAQLTILQGSRHGITLQHRQRTADLVRAFILDHA